MTGEQFYKLVSDYGPAVAIITFLVVGALLLIAMFKPVSRFFLAVNTILEMPAKFADLVSRLNRQDLVAAEKQVTLSQLSEQVSTTNVRLERHIEDAKAQTANFDRDMRPRLETLILNSEITAHEMRHNGGSSVKDDARATREKLERIERLLAEKLPTGPIARL